MNPVVSRWLARVAYVQRADAAMRARLAALEDTPSIGELPGWVPRPPAELADEFPTGPWPVTRAAFREGEARDSRGRWTSGGGAGGGGKGLSPDVLGAVDRNLARWAEHQDYPVASEPLQPAVMGYFAEAVDRLGRRLRKKADKERWASDKGVQFTRYALDKSSHMPGTKVFVASAKPARPGPGDLAGAISFYEQEEAGERFVHVDYLGTTGTAAGAGTALAHAVARYAAARHLGVMGEPENQGADVFWSKIGWHPDPLDLGATTFAGWTPDEAAEVAARGQ